MTWDINPFLLFPLMFLLLILFTICVSLTVSPKLTITLLTIITILYALVYYQIRAKCNKVHVYTYDSEIPGPNVLLVASTHGNEPAGGVALNRLVSLIETGALQVKQGSLTIVPVVNGCGTNMDMRYQPHQMMILQSPDINRNYPVKRNQKAKCYISQTIADLATQNDVVVDLHEGWGFNRVDASSMGSGIFPGHTPLSQILAQTMALELNQNLEIPSAEESTNPNKLNQMQAQDFQFRVLPDWPDVRGSLRWWCGQNNIDYVLLETSGQNDIVTLRQRADQQLTAVMSVLKTLDMIR